MAKKKSVTLAGITIKPSGPIIVGNMYAAYATLPPDEGLIWLKVITSGTGRQYPTVTQDGETRASFFIDRAGDYLLRFVRDDETLAEISFSA